MTIKIGYPAVAATTDQISQLRLDLGIDDLAVAQAGTVNGSTQSVFSFAADTGERIVGIILNFNAASDVQASEQIAAGIYSLYPIDHSGEIILRSLDANIERVAITALASTTYATGDVIAIDETTAATVLSCMSFVVAPTASAVALTLSSVPTYTAEKVTAADVTLKFAEAA